MLAHTEEDKFLNRACFMAFIVAMKNYQYK
jgi:hypothetical protein